MTGVRDVAAIDDWVRLHADDDDARQVKASLPSLPVGTGWVWSPGWLELLQRVQVRRPDTFDSSATPRPGQRRPTARRMAAVDLAALGEQITATQQQATYDSPAELRRIVADLRRQLASRPATPPPERVEVEVPVLSADALSELRRTVGEWQGDARRLLDVAEDLHRRLNQLPTPTATAEHPRLVAPLERSRPPSPGPATSPAHPDQRVETNETERLAGQQPLPKAQRAILTALAQQGPSTVVQVALLTGYSHKSGGYRNALSALRSAGYIEGRGDITVTAAGLDALGPFPPLPTGAALLEWWKTNQLGRAERAIVDVLAEAWPAALPVDEIAVRTGYSATSGGFRNALSRLRSLELAAGRGALTLAATLTSP